MAKYRIVRDCDFNGYALESGGDFQVFATRSQGEVNNHLARLGVDRAVIEEIDGRLEYPVLIELPGIKVGIRLLADGVFVVTTY